MKKEILIKKWLDNELTADELKEFKQLEEYDSYVKLSEKAQFFKAPDYSSTEAYEKFKTIIEEKRSRKNNKKIYFLIAQMAAAFIIGFGLFSVIFSSGLTTIKTLASENQTVILPDNSIVKLNSLSEISYSEKKWNKKRKLDLKGEAYFKVAKGATFLVETSSGVVSVHGTQFNVKSRNNYFEVQCFEGLVSVVIDEKEIMLPAGNVVQIVNGVRRGNKISRYSPTWLDNKSSFVSVPLSEVISEFERQYNVFVKAEINTEVLFTGMFVNNNKEEALKSITIPFDLKYSIDGNKITLIKIE